MFLKIGDKISFRRNGANKTGNFYLFSNGSENSQINQIY